MPCPSAPTLSPARSFAFLLLAACLTTVTVGCGSAVQQPTATFKSADLQTAGANGFKVDFGVNVDNPNGFILPISAAKYKLGLAGVTVVDETAKPAASIPAKGTGPVSIPISLDFERLLKAEKGLVSTGGNVPYQFDGVLEFSVGPLAALGQSVKVPVSFTGTLPFRDAIKDPVAFVQTPGGRKLAQMLLGKNSVIDNLFGK
jgi:LEA14-like dessication related protein